MAKSKLIKANEKVAEKVIGAHKSVEKTVVGGYKKIEDAFVARYLTHDGETVEEAKARLYAEQEARREQEQRSCRTAQTPDYVKQAQEQTMEHIEQARKLAHVPGTKN